MIIRRIRDLIGLVLGGALMLALPTKAGAQLLQVSPTQLSFSGGTGGNTPAPQAVAILATGQSAVNFAVQITGSGTGSPAPAWLTVNVASGTTPSGLIVSVNQAGLVASGSPYAAALQISVPNNNSQSPIVIPVTLTVSDTAAQLVVTPMSLRFAARVQAPGTFTQTILLNNSGGGGLPYTTSIIGQNPPAFWISGITPSSGGIAPNSPVLLQVVVNTQGLAVGSYHQVIQITSPAGSINVPVSLFISDHGAILGLNATGLRFSVLQGTSTSTPQSISIRDLGDSGSTVSWTADLPYGSNWLTLGASNGSASPGVPGTLSLSPNSSAANLPAGGSYALVRVSDPNALDSPQYVVVVLDVEGTASPSLANIVPAGMLFSTANGAPAAQTVNVYTGSTTPSGLQVSTITADGAAWLKANATTATASAQTPGQVSVTVNSTTLTPGVYNGKVNIAIGSVLRTANVTLIVAQATCVPNGLAITATSLANNFAVPAGWPTPLSVQLNDNCGNPVTNGSIVASFSNGDAPLSLVGDQQTGTYSATWQPGLVASGASIAVTASAPCCGSSTTQIFGAITSNASPLPTLVPNGALNIFFNAADAAQYGAALAPGDVAQVYGVGLASTATATTLPLPPQLDGTFLMVGGLNAPLFYISGGLLDVQIPFELTANRQYQAIVSVNGAFTLPETIDIVPFQPGIAAYSDGSVIAQHLDFSLVTASSPAKPNETLIIYLAGMGATNPSVASGLQTPSQLVPTTVQPTVTVDGQNASFGYAGLSPSGIGLYQINFTVPANTRLGNVNLIVNQDGVTDSVTLPVAGTPSGQQLALTPNPLNLTSAIGALTITLPAAAGTSAQIVNLTSSNAAIATVPTSVVIAPGTTSASVMVTPGNASGKATITASAPGFTSGSTSVNVTAAGPASITAVSGAGQSAAINSLFSNPLSVIVKDANGNPVNGVAVTFTAPSSGASAVLPSGLNTATTNASGVATSPIFTANGSVGSYTVTASVAGISTTATFFLTNTSATPASISATGGTGQSGVVSGAFPNALLATVKDANGNLLGGVTVTFTVPSSGASATFAGGVNTATTSASGVATSAALTANATAGSFIVTASVAGVSTTASFSLTNTAGSPVSISATSGSGQSAVTSATFSNRLVATVKDAGGNPVSGVTVTFSVPLSGASAVFAGGVNSATTNASGMATSAALIANGTIGSYTVSAFVAGLSAPATFSLTNAAASQTAITATSGSGQSVAINTVFSNPLVATVKSASGVPLGGVTVTFSAPTSGASALFAGGVNTATTNPAGVATSAVLTANGTPGSYTVNASVASSSTLAAFQLTNTAGQASITAVSGGGQSAVINTAFGSPLVAIVKDASSNPLSGVVVTFTVPSGGASAVFAGGVNTATTNASGVATSPGLTANGTTGTYSVAASISGVSNPASFSLTNVSNVTAGALAVSVSSSTVGQNLQTTGTVNVLVAAPAGGISVTLTSSAPSKLLLANGPTGTGSGSITVLIAQGTTSIGFSAFGAASSGTATITASTASLTSGTTTVTLAPSGFVLAGPGGIGTATISTTPGATTALTVSAAQLDSSLNYVQTQAVAGGVSVSVNVTSSTPAVGTISGSPVAIAGGATSGTAQFNAVGTGSTSLSVSAPSGFSAPAADTSVTATVISSSLITGPVTVGKNLETIVSIALSAATTSPVPITITSNNPSQLLLAGSGTDAGSTSIVVTVPANSSGTQFFVYGLASSGSPTYAATASGMGTATGTVNLAPSGIVITGPNGDIPSFFANIAQGTQQINVFSALLDSSSNYVAAMSLAGGQSVSVTVTSSNPSAGTITGSPVTISGGNDTAMVQFNPGSQGNSTLTVSTPPGFTTPTAGTNLLPGPSVTANVNSPGISLIDDGIVGKNLADPGSVGIAPAAPAGGVVITLTSNDPNLLLSATGQDSGSLSIKVTIPAGSTTAPYYIYALASSGTGSYTASALGHINRTNTINYAPSGVVALGAFAIPGGQQVLSASVGTPTNITVAMSALDTGGNSLIQQALAGFASGVTVSLSSSNTSVGTIAPSAIIPSGGMSVPVRFTPVSAGKTTVTVATPNGYSTPVSNNVMVLVTVPQ